MPHAYIEVQFYHLNSLPGLRQKFVDARFTLCCKKAPTHPRPLSTGTKATYSSLQASE